MKPLKFPILILLLVGSCAIGFRKEEPVFSSNFNVAVDYYLKSYGYNEFYSSAGGYLSVNVSSDTLKLTISSWPGMFYDFDCYLGEVNYDDHLFIISRNYLTTDDAVFSSFIDLNQVKRLEREEFRESSINIATGPEDYITGHFLIHSGYLTPLF